MLPAVVDPAKAQAPARRRSTRSRRTTRSINGISATRRRSDAAFKAAKHVTKLDIVNNRLVPNAMEPRAAIGEYDSGTDSFTLWNTTQNPHVARLVISAFVGMAPEHKLRVIAPDVGGGFGSKIFIYPEEVVCLWASKRVGRPVKWTCDRSEAFLADAHGRDHVTHAEMAFDDDGKIPALRVKTIANLGAYMSTFSSSVPTYLYAHAAVGPVRHPGDLLRGRCGLHQHRAGRRLSRRRAAGGDLRGRAAGRGRRARAGRRSGRSAPQELHQDVPAPDAGDHDLRRRRLSRLAQQGDGARRLQGLRQAQARGGARTASCAASASRPTSRPAASRRRRRSARSAPASACGNPPRCGSTRPARSKS